MNKSPQADPYLTFTGAGQDLSGHLENMRRGLRRRLHAGPAIERPAPAPSDIVPLTAAQQDELERLTKEVKGEPWPVVKRVAWSVANRWRANPAEIEQLACVYAAEAVQQFDRRGDIDGFVAQRVKHRLTDYFRYEHRRYAGLHPKVRYPDYPHNPRRSVAMMKRGKRGKSSKDDIIYDRSCRDVNHDKTFADDGKMPKFCPGDEFKILDDPSRRLRLTELLADVRHKLTTEEQEIIRLRNNAVPVKDIAKQLHCSSSRVYKLMQDAEQFVMRRAAVEGFTFHEVVWHLVNRNRKVNEDKLDLLFPSLREDSAHSEGRPKKIASFASVQIQTGTSETIQ